MSWASVPSLRRLPLLAAACLAACTTVPLAPGASPWISGRLSVRIEASATQPGHSVSAEFDLRGSGDSGELHLNSPLGTRLAAARWAPGIAVLSTPDGERRFDNLDDLSRLALGEALPLAALTDWIAGRPWPGAPHRLLEGGFEQLGWQVQSARLAEGRLEARREAPPVVAVRVRVNPPQP